MQNPESHRRWGSIYTKRPFSQEPAHFANIANSVFMTEYLKAVLMRCPSGGSALETGIGYGHASIWLSQQSVIASGIDNVPDIVERARQVNNLLGC